MIDQSLRSQTTPGTAIICDPCWSWWYGCTIGSVNIIAGSTSADAFGKNIGGGLTYRLGETHTKFYTENLLKFWIINERRANRRPGAPGPASGTWDSTRLAPMWVP
jgi:hypothetical protein